MFDSYSDIFARRAAQYHAAMAAFPNARDAEFALIVEPLSLCAGEILCDVPAGGGYLRPFLPADIFYVAVEPSEDFFSACPEDAMAKRLRCPAEAIALPASSADHVVSLAGLHHAPDLAIVFAEMRRIARPGARLVIADVAQGSAEDAFLNDFVHRHNPHGHNGQFLDETTRALVQSSGFAIDDDAILPCPWIFPDAASRAAFCKNLFGIDEATGRMIDDAIRQIFGRDAQCSDTMMPWALRRIVATAIG